MGRGPTPRECYIPKGAETEELDGGDLIARYIGGKGQPCAMVFHGRAQKPDWHHVFRSEEQRERYIADWQKNVGAHREAMAERKERRSSFEHGFQVGDILNGSWGYEQTNVDFWQVVEVHGREIVIRHIAGELVNGEEGFMQGRLMPLRGRFLEQSGDSWATLRKRPQAGYNGDGSKGQVKITSYLYAHEWDGAPKFCSWYG